MNWPTPVRFLVTVWTCFWVVIVTVVLGLATILLALLGVRQDKIQVVPRLWARLLLWATFSRVQKEGTANVEPGATYVFACNHQSMVDILVLLAKLPKNFRWIAKKELFAVPLFGRAMLSAGYIPIDRSDREAAYNSLQTAARRIATGASVVIFPEGTRTNDTTLLEFKVGGFGLAVESGRPVMPVAIVGAGKVMPKGSLLINPGKIRLIFGKPVYPRSKDRGEKLRLSLEVYDRMHELLTGAGVPVQKVGREPRPEK